MLSLVFEMPSWSTLILGLVIAVFAALKGIELRQGKSKQALIDDANHWKNNCAAAEKQAELVEADKKRLREEKEALQHEKDLLTQEAMRLRTQTDIKPALDAIANSQQTMIGWIEEGRRRFDESMHELVDTRAIIVKGLAELFAETKANRLTSEDAFRTYTTTFVQHVEEDRTGWFKLLNMFAAMEGRMNMLGLQMGIVKWPDAEQVPFSPEQPNPEDKQNNKKKASGGAKQV